MIHHLIRQGNTCGLGGSILSCCSMLFHILLDLGQGQPVHFGTSRYNIEAKHALHRFSLYNARPTGVQR